MYFFLFFNQVIDLIEWLTWLTDLIEQSNKDLVSPKCANAPHTKNEVIMFQPTLYYLQIVVLTNSLIKMEPIERKILISPSQTITLLWFGIVKSSCLRPLGRDVARGGAKDTRNGWVTARTIYLQLCVSSPVLDSQNRYYRTQKFSNFLSLSRKRDF